MRALAGLISLGRFLIGVAFIVRPKILDQGWIGKQARLPGAQVLGRAVGSRDLALGAGGLQAVARGDGSARAWLAAAAACDAVDFGATWAAGRKIPRQARVSVLTIAAGSAVLSALAAAGSRPGDDVEPPPATEQNLSGAMAVPSEVVSSGQ